MSSLLEFQSVFYELHQPKLYVRDRDIHRGRTTSNTFSNCTFINELTNNNSLFCFSSFLKLSLSELKAALASVTPATSSIASVDACIRTEYVQTWAISSSRGFSRFWRILFLSGFVITQFSPLNFNLVLMHNVGKQLVWLKNQPDKIITVLPSSANEFTNVADTFTFVWLWSTYVSCSLCPTTSFEIPLTTIVVEAEVQSDAASGASTSSG